MLKQGRVEVRKCLEHHRDGQGKSADAQLHQAIPAKGAGYLGGPAPPELAAERQTCHEGGEQCTEGKGRRPKDMGQHTRPDDLEDQPAGPADQEEKKDQWSSTNHVSGRGSHRACPRSLPG